MAVVDIVQKNSILYCTLNRPEIHNAFNDEVLHLLWEVFRDLHSPEKYRDVRVCVLQARGRSFSAGADLQWMRRMRQASEEENLEDARKLAQTIYWLLTCPIPTIARVQGAAFGGGAGLLAACDFVVALKKAKIGFTEAKLGLAPACISEAVIFRVGPKVARQLFLTAHILTAEEAQQVGLVDVVATTEEEMDTQIGSWISQLLTCSPQALKACKMLTYQIPKLSAEEVQELGACTISSLRVSEEGQEGIAAFFEKRKPRWVPNSSIQMRNST